jgi:two-component system, cell cycle response regulator
MLRPTPNAGIKILAALLVAGFAVFVAHVLLGLGGSGVSDLIDHWLYAAILVGAAGLCLARAARISEQRAGWTLIGLGLLAFAMGDLYWTQVLEDRAGEVTFPSLADVGYLLYYPLTFAGIVLVVAGRLRSRPAGLWLDAATVALAVASIGSAVVIEAVSDGLGTSFSALFEGLTYPVADLVLLAFLAAILVMCGRRPGTAIALLVAGVGTMVVADAAYSYALSEGTYTEVSALNILWPLSSLFVATAAWAPVLEPVNARPPKGWRALLVSGAVGVAAVAGYAYARISGGDPVTEALLLATILAVLARLAFAFAENERLLERVSHDQLTGLANRGQLEQDLREAIWKRRGPSVLALLDLDGFKTYNDNFGHPAGDDLLIRLAARLDKAVGTSGRAYRVGGDEFCILVQGDRDAAGVATARARAAFSEGGVGFEVTCSMGRVELPTEVQSPEAAIQLADARMYDEKQSSRASASEQVLAVLRSAQRERTPELSSHTRDVAELAVAVARHLGLDPGEIDLVERAAELHDIGKVAIPDAILDKPARLTRPELAYVQRHSVIGERILAAAPDLLPVARIVRSSHERFDGTGYPDALKGDEIPIAARVIFVCDAFCAMTTPRPYSQAVTPREALAELRRCAGTQFDPAVVTAFGQVLARGGPELAQGEEPRRPPLPRGNLAPRPHGSTG